MSAAEDSLRYLRRDPCPSPEWLSYAVGNLLARQAYADGPEAPRAIRLPPDRAVRGRLLDPHEAAKLAGVDVSTLRRRARAGQLRSVRTPGGQHRYYEFDLLPKRA